MSANPPAGPDSNSTPDAPAPGPLTWFSLGLWALSWLTLFGLFVYGLVSAPTGSLTAYLVAGFFWLLFTGPHLLFGYSLWRGGREHEVVFLAFVAGLFQLSFTLVLLALVLVASPGSQVGPGIVCIAVLNWLAGWPLGIRAVVLARRQSPLAPLDDE